MNRFGLLAVFIILLSLFSVTSTYGKGLAEDKSETEQGTATVSAKIEYNLAFPGILPDHPLYKLKVLRNKISSILIGDPYKRTEFYLLQADKGILATAMLVDKNKIELANETALKAENNITLLSNELYRFSEKPQPEFFNKLKTASLKHQEVLVSLIKRLPDNQQKTLKQVLYFSESNLQTIERFQNKKFYSN